MRVRVEEKRGVRGSMNVSTVSTPTSTTTSLLTVGKTTRHNAKYLPDSRRIKKGSRGRRGDGEIKGRGITAGG